ncbi:hypothetical protein [Dishui Lake phycodnavirus 4]|nr:hypothetical protein [Dishui Lake phycodnavirus 4]
MSPEVKASSTPPQRDEEDEIEIEDEEYQVEGDVDGDDDNGDDDDGEGEGDDEELEFNDEMFDDGMNAIGGLLSATLATEEGDTVCTALLDIASQLATQNKILLKILSTLNKKDN